jgi:hypothetical protein
MKILDVSDRNIKAVDFEDGRVGFGAKTWEGISELTLGFINGTYKDVLEIGKMADGAVFFVIFKGGSNE